MTCPNCGAVLQPGATFCTNCGAAVTANYDYQQNPYAPVVSTVDPGKGTGIASLILGISGLVLSLVCSWCYGSGTMLGLICAIIGLILGSSAIKASAEVGLDNGMAKAGKICSIITIVLDVLAILAIVAIFILYFIMGIGIGLSGGYY